MVGMGESLNPWDASSEIYSGGARVPIAFAKLYESRSPQNFVIRTLISPWPEAKVNANLIENFNILWKAAFKNDVILVAGNFV